MMTYNPPYYAELFEQFGLKKIRDLYAYYGEGKEPPEKVAHIAEAIRKKERITVRPIIMKNFDQEAEKVWKIYNQAWIKNWGFVPMTEEEFKHLAKNLKHAIVPDIALMAEIDGKPVGFSLALPDLNQALIHTNGRLFPFGLLKILWYSRKIDKIRIIIMGVIREYRKHGIDAMLYIDTWKNGAKRGFYKGEMSWILEDNKMMRRAAERLGGTIYRTYRMYQMKV
jgi:GNAT superfamily N-acetyltransferase